MTRILHDQTLQLPKLPLALWRNQFTDLIPLPVEIGELIRQYCVQNQQLLICDRSVKFRIEKIERHTPDAFGFGDVLSFMV